MKMITVLFFCAHFGLNPSFSHATEGDSLVERAPLFMAVGEQRILAIGDLKHYSMSGDALRYTRLPSGKHLLLKAIKPGQSTLILSYSPTRSESRTIRVELKKNLPFPASLYQALNHLNEIEVLEEGEHFVLRGNLRQASEANRVAYLLNQFPKFVINETTLDDSWAKQAQSEVQTLIQKYPTLTLSEIEGQLWIFGSLRHKGDAAAIEKKVRAIQPLTQFDIQSVNDHDPTIYFKVFLLEVKKDLLTEFGVGWPKLQTGTLQVSPFQIMMNSPIELTLNALTQKGSVNILSSPELVVRAPGQAEIFAGGELPIRQKSRNNDSVFWKNIGLMLKLDVQSVIGDQVRLNVETGMSHLDSNLMNDDIPGVQTNHIKTQVDAKLGKPLLLSGLLQEDIRERTQGLTGLSSIPILGKLFSSESFRKNKSELVAILLPYHTLPPHPMQRVSSTIPKGYLPLPRNTLSSDELEAKKENTHYPWNVL